MKSQPTNLIALIEECQWAIFHFRSFFRHFHSILTPNWGKKRITVRLERIYVIRSREKKRLLWWFTEQVIVLRNTNWPYAVKMLLNLNIFFFSFIDTIVNKRWFKTICTRFQWNVGYLSNRMWDEEWEQIWENSWLHSNNNVHSKLSSIENGLSIRILILIHSFIPSFTHSKDPHATHSHRTYTFQGLLHKKNYIPEHI